MDGYKDSAFLSLFCNSISDTQQDDVKEKHTKEQLIRTYLNFMSHILSALFLFLFVKTPLISDDVDTQKAMLYICKEDYQLNAQINCFCAPSLFAWCWRYSYYTYMWYVFCILNRCTMHQKWAPEITFSYLRIQLQLDR